MMNPFVAGSWVRGPQFFGRGELLQSILSGGRHAIWLLGMRRVGKTSVLKQLEWLASSEPWNDQYLPIYWDMQGSNDAEGLRESLFESLEDAEDAFAQCDIDPAELEADDLFRILRLAMRAVSRSGRRLLLLCDEAEELIQVASTDVVSLRRLRRLLLQGEKIRCILAATKRMGDALGGQVEGTSPFLNGFLPPLYLRHFDSKTARELLTGGGVPDADAKLACRFTGGHPYLVQLIGRRIFSGSGIEETIEELKADELVKAFFRVDFSYLLETEKKVIFQVFQQGSISRFQLESDSGYSGEHLRSLLHSLEMAGYLKKEEDRFGISNDFFRHWLRHEQLWSDGQAKLSETTAPNNFSATGSLEERSLAQYRIVKPLGHGGMGTVYLAHDRNLGRQVALKVIRSEVIHSPTVSERFQREARTISSLNHGGIVTVYEFRQVDGVWFLAMEMVDGVDLRTFLAESTGPVPQSSALRWSTTVAKILAYAHEAGVIHRDVKPANVMLTSQGAIKVLDFGLAKLHRPDAVSHSQVTASLTQEGFVIGTLAYMSPEQAQGLPVGPATDQFSLGCLLYELLTKRLPFSAKTSYEVIRRLVSEEPVPAGKIRPDIPAATESILHRLLQKRPEDRYPSMDDAAKALQNLENSSPSPLLE